MSSRITFLDEIALADMAFEVIADTPHELFTAATAALIETLADPATVGTSWEQPVDRSADDLPTLLFDWLEEMVYLKDARGVVFHDASLVLDGPAGEGGWRLHGRLRGERIDRERQNLGSDVKGVTKHLYHVTETSEGWQARVVLDV